MFEFVVVWILARHNGRLAAARGQRASHYWWLTFGLWFGAEIGGSIIGLVILGTGRVAGVYVVALVSAIAGGVLAWQAAKRAPQDPNRIWRPNALAPPEGLLAWAQPDGRVPPIAVLPGNAQLQVADVSGDWALVVAPNGWRGCVDTRLLIPTATWLPFRGRVP